MNKIKEVGWVKAVTIVLTIFLIVLGILSVFVPGLEVVANNSKTILVVIGIVVSAGLVDNILPLKLLQDETDLFSLTAVVVTNNGALFI